MYLPSVSLAIGHAPRIGFTQQLKDMTGCVASVVVVRTIAFGTTNRVPNPHESSGRERVWCDSLLTRTGGTHS